MKNYPREFEAARAASLTRRCFLRECGLGVAGMAAGALPGPGDNRCEPTHQGAHFAPRAKSVVYLFHAGAPSHLELFDPKPQLTRHDGRLPPAELLQGYRAAFINPNSALLGPKYRFARRGRSGIEISELLPHLGSIVDDLCFIRSMQTDAVNHAPAQILMNTGSQQFGRPSFGAWTLYGLGSENEELPGYVVLTSAKGTSGGASNYGCGFLPTAYAGVPFRNTGDPVLYLSNPSGIDRRAQRDSLDALERLNQLALNDIGDPEIAARIQAYEMAYRLQTSVPELMDLDHEPQSILDLYGIRDVKEASYARNCLLARRLIERGVRFVQLFHEAWDQHGNLTRAIRENCDATDRAGVRPWSRTSNNEDCWVIPWSFGEANSVEPRWCREETMAGTITTDVSRCGWLVAVSRKAMCTAKRTTSASTSSVTPSTFTT